MDPRLLDYYNRELQFIREVGGEFAQEYPKIAGRLGLDGFECADPYVERLLEGFAFLAGRVQLKLDDEFPRFTQHLLEMVYPHYLAPTPSMVVAEFQPDLTEGGLAEGYLVPRGSVLRSRLGKGDQTACEYRTGHDLHLWPLELIEAEYFTNTTIISDINLPNLPSVKAGIRLRLQTTAGLSFDQLKLDKLPVYLRGEDHNAIRLYEQMLGNAVAMVVRPADRDTNWHHVIDRSQIRRYGFHKDQSLLPYGPRSFSGYRLLHEYFAFPERDMFVELGGLAPGIARGNGTQLDLMVLFDRTDSMLEDAVAASNFKLFCAPAINLFPKRADRIHLSERFEEHHVIPDRTRPMDYEVYEVTGVQGFGTSAEPEQEFLPFYALNDMSYHHDHKAYYTLRRTPRVLSSKQRRVGARSSYIGGEVFVSMVDATEAPYSHSLKQLAVQTLCTNRDLPLHMSVGQGKTDFTMESGAPVDAVRCLAGPTRPRPSPVHARGETTWRLISHLSLNYHSINDNDESRGAAALRELLGLYADMGEADIRKMIDGIRSVESHMITRRMPTPGPITFGRGLEISVTCDDVAFEGTGIFLLGAVLDEFFTRYVSINSFTETVVRSIDRAEVMRWPAKSGRRHTL